MIYIALLRGINVGGKNKMPMAELKRVLENLGFKRVTTYIQSGNVLFDASGDEAELQRIIEEGLAAAFGFAPAVILRTLDQLQGIVDGCPFPASDIAEAEASAIGESLYVTFLREEPSPEQVKKLQDKQFGADRFHLSGRDAYLLFYTSVRNSKLAAGVEKLGTTTTRNWNTINKLVQLAGQMK